MLLAEVLDCEVVLLLHVSIHSLLVLLVELGCNFKFSFGFLFLLLLETLTLELLLEDSLSLL